MTTPRPFRVCLVGTGSFAKVHAACWRRIAGARLEAVAGRTREAAARFEFADASTKRLSLEEAFAAFGDFDLFDVVTPTDTHTTLGIRALEAGAHLLVEKPIARTVTEARVLGDAAAAAHRSIAVVSQYRWVPAYRILKERIRELKLERVHARLIQTPEMSGILRTDSWKRDLARTGGGCLMGTAVHLIDLLHWMLGPLGVVRARFEQASDGFETAARIDARSERCAIEFEAAIRTGAPPEMTLELETRRGRIGVVERRLRGAPLAWKAEELRDGLASRLDPARREPLGRQMREVITTLREGGTPEPGLDAGRRVLEFVEAAYRAGEASV